MLDPIERPNEICWSYDLCTGRWLGKLNIFNCTQEKVWKVFDFVKLKWLTKLGRSPATKLGRSPIVNIKDKMETKKKYKDNGADTPTIRRSWLLALDTVREQPASPLGSGRDRGLEPLHPRQLVPSTVGRPPPLRLDPPTLEGWYHSSRAPGADSESHPEHLKRKFSAGAKW